jgi:oxaloacetate decarboxylase alpha subunit
MKSLGIIDTTLRDAHQSLWATRMTTAHMLPVAATLDRAGFDQIDLAGTIQFDVAVRYLREDPWERVRMVRELVRDTPLRSLVRSRNLVAFDVLPDDIIELWVERLVANGFRVVGTFDGLNDIDNIVASTRVAHRLGVKTFGALSYSVSPVHTDEVYVRTAQKLIASGTIDSIMLKDAGGLLTVDRIRTLVPAIKAVIGSVPLEIHSHCLTGLAPLVYLEAAALGADQLHCSTAPLANGAAQPATQSVVRNLRLDGFSTRVDLDALREVSEHFQRVAESENKPVGKVLEYDAFHYRHQIPGGMLSNFRSQLEHAGLSHKFDELLEEVARVREELGYPIMITPFAQLVGTQAVLNVVHGDRYRVVPDEIKKYALGYYGRLMAPVDPEVLDRIVMNGSSRIGLTPVPPEPAVAALRRKYPSASDDERLLRYMLPGNHVDQMRAAGPTRTELQYHHPIVEMLRDLQKRPRIGRIHVSRPGLDLRISGPGV